MEDSTIYLIPDCTFGGLIQDIAEEKENNISMIFDCYHSASGTRVNKEAYAHRTVHLDSIIPEDLDQDIWGGRAGKIAPGFTYHGSQSHVLLATCGEKELAYEHERCDLFTTGLLETLKSCAIDNLTYSEVLEHIHLNKYEYNPRCEGFNQHRVIFDVRVPAGR
ncbi:hypothetical protein J3R83DRAFT_4001 [Lanmaoa asiatica]|nr:hypothetical protein J3R83DRAFT_4001 [Lanmaoa asiatica]